MGGVYSSREFCGLSNGLEIAAAKRPVGKHPVDGPPGQLSDTSTRSDSPQPAGRRPFAPAAGARPGAGPNGVPGVLPGVGREAPWKGTVELLGARLVPYAGRL
jgi:hypothetical protein